MIFFIIICQLLLALWINKCVIHLHCDFRFISSDIKTFSLNFLGPIMHVIITIQNIHKSFIITLNNLRNNFLKQMLYLVEH